MAQVQPLFDFVQDHAEISKEAFLERVRVPYLYFPNLPDLALTPSGLDDTKELERDVYEDLGMRGVVPVQKDAVLRAFNTMITLGRKELNDIHIPDGRVSNFHAYLRLTGKHWTITDANSTNGTLVDGVELCPSRTRFINPGSRVTLGGVVEFLFLDPIEMFDLLKDLRELVLV